MDDPNYDPNYITRDKCDSCGQHGWGAMFHHYSTPVMFLCTSCCATTVIERLARRDIDAWLNEPAWSCSSASSTRTIACRCPLGWTGTEVR